MNVEPDSLEHLLLYQAEPDWLPLAGADSYASHFEKAPKARRPLLLSAVGSLVRSGCLAVGNLQFVDDQQSDVVWEEWPGDVDGHLQNLALIYDPGYIEDTSWAWVCWFDITEAGERVLAGLGEPDDRFFN